jgi:YidC/Oxa1 family membrane protein insertase
MAQQFYVIRRNPAPGTPAYEAWEERRKARMKRRGEEPEEGGEPGGNGARPLTPVPSGNGSTAAATAPRVVRQQPRKQSRSKRKR